MDIDGSYQFRMDQNGSEWIRINHNDLQLTMMDHNGSKWLKMAPNGSQWITLKALNVAQALDDFYDTFVLPIWKIMAYVLQKHNYMLSGLFKLT